MPSLNCNLLTILLLSNLLCFHVLLVPVSAKVFLSIDCGSSSSKPYTDENSLEWVGDDQYIQTGEARNIISKDEMYGSDPHVMNTLREFKTRKKNCYSIDINNGMSRDNTKVERVLVRASFFYGNYDNKSHPPTLELQFNGNKWVQVITDTCLTYDEVVYSLNHGNTITVCLAQTHPDNIPFISALEVRSLDSDTYNYVDSNYPLIFWLRTYYGTSKTVRYPEDVYDRFWISDEPPSNTSVFNWVRNNLPSIKVNISDKIPEALFRSALTSSNFSGQIWNSYIFPNVSVPLYFNAYFSEVSRLSSTQKRSFDVLAQKTGDTNFSVIDTVTPPFGDALQVRIENVTAFSNDTWYIGLVPTNDSTLPPLINALEGFIIGDKLVREPIQMMSFIQLQDWQGDPCLPSPYTWDWVACDADTDSPRITALYLDGLGLAGTLPDFSDMNALETIDLHNNSLTQEIPEFLGALPNLHVLNLADNNFSGAIPSSLLNNKSLKLSVSGNPNLSTNNTSINRNSTEPRIPSSSNNKNSITSTIPVIVFGSAIIQMLDYIFGVLL